MYGLRPNPGDQAPERAAVTAIISARVWAPFGDTDQAGGKQLEAVEEPLDLRTGPDVPGCGGAGVVHRLHRPDGARPARGRRVAEHQAAAGRNGVPQRSQQLPVRFQKSATGPDAGFYAVRSYSLTRPPRTGRRLIRSWERSATGWPGRGGRSWPTAVRPPSVVVGLVLGQDHPQMPLAEDQQLVGDLGPGGQHEPFRLSVRARVPGRNLHRLDTGVGQDRVKRRGGPPRLPWRV
jgi:hypothetical protein